jgi:hypothetical protein
MSEPQSKKKDLPLKVDMRDPADIPQAPRITRLAQLNSPSARIANVDITMGAGSDFSFEWRKDKFEEPQTETEEYAVYRHLVAHDPLVARAIHLLTSIPVSKTRLNKPKSSNKKLNEACYNFCLNWSDEFDLESMMYELLKSYKLLGKYAFYIKDSNPVEPLDIRNQVDDDGNPLKDNQGNPIPRPPEEASLRYSAWIKENYKGWTGYESLPPERVIEKVYPFHNNKVFEIALTEQELQLVTDAENGDLFARRILETMDPALKQSLLQKKPIRASDDPELGISFLICGYRKTFGYDTHGTSILKPALHTLIHREKLRQAEAMSANGKSEPTNLVTVPNASDPQLDEVRSQIMSADRAPGVGAAIISNAEINWEVVGIEDRIPDFSSQYDRTRELLYACWGVTESLMTGESAYQGDRINLEVMNTLFDEDRRMLIRIIEQKILKPMCRRAGFVDDEGKTVYPKLSFTRVALRDNADQFDHLFTLYQKGSMPVDVILDHLGFDSDVIHEKLKKDLFTILDPVFNDLVRDVYSEDIAKEIVQATTVTDKIIEALGLVATEEADDDDDGY